VTPARARQLRCAHCDRPFDPPPRAKPGPVPTYCGRTCRQRAYELRVALPELEKLRREVRSLRRANRTLHEELRKLGWTPERLDR
jgi:hypothetical protein